MDPTPSGLSESELTSLAAATGRDAECLAAELEKRPWAIHDLLSDPALVKSVLTPDDLDPCESAFVFFAVMTRAVANDLLDRSFVHDWAGPSFRLPVFDVEPLQEFVAAPHRVLFIARLLTSMVRPVDDPIPSECADPLTLVGWLTSVEGDSRNALLRRIGDLSLYIAGVHADAIGHVIVTPHAADHIGQALGLDPDETRALCDPASPAPGLDALEIVGARSYQEARRGGQATPPIVSDVAERMRAARRFLTHLSDQFLAPPAPDLPSAA